MVGSLALRRHTTRERDLLKEGKVAGSGKFGVKSTTSLNINAHILPQITAFVNLHLFFCLSQLLGFGYAHTRYSRPFHTKPLWLTKTGNHWNRPDVGSRYTTEKPSCQLGYEA